MKLSLPDQLSISDFNEFSENGKIIVSATKGELVFDFKRNTKSKRKKIEISN